MFPRNNTYKYSSCRLILLQLKNGKDLTDGVTYIQGNKIYEDRDGSVEFKNLEQGSYYYYVEMDW
jgi:hypothetical protein